MRLPIIGPFLFLMYVHPRTFSNIIHMEIKISPWVDVLSGLYNRQHSFPLQMEIHGSTAGISSDSSSYFELTGEAPSDSPQRVARNRMSLRIFRRVKGVRAVIHKV